MGRLPRKKADIERAALELFVDQGVDGTSVRDISTRSGVTEGALYRHHKTKDDLVRALFARHYAEFAELVAELRKKKLPIDEFIAELVMTFYAYYDEDPYIFHFVMLVRHKLLEEVRADEHNPVELLSRILKRAERNKEIPKQNTAITTQLLLGMVMQVPIGCYYGRIKKPLVKHAERVTQACLAVMHGGG